MIYTLLNHLMKRQKLNKASGITKLLCEVCYKIISIFEPHLYQFGRKNGINDTPGEERVVVSLTSFPKRIKSVWITVESIMRQSYKANEIILWLANDEFPGGDKDLPQSLLQLKCRGLNIKYCENLFSHKKYYYTFREYPDDLVITLDDDVIYPSDAINELMKLHQRYPKAVCCNVGHQMTWTPDKQIMPYTDWISNPVGEKLAYSICPVGIGGVLYPPHCIDTHVFDKDIFMELCKYADDIWLKMMCVRNHTKTAKADYRFPGIPSMDTSMDSLFLTVNSKKYDGIDMNTLQMTKVIQHYCIDEVDLYEEDNRFGQ